MGSWQAGTGHLQSYSGLGHFSLLNQASYIKLPELMLGTKTIKLV